MFFCQTYLLLNSSKDVLCDHEALNQTLYAFISGYGNLFDDTPPSRIQTHLIWCTWLASLYILHEITWYLWISVILDHLVQCYPKTCGNPTVGDACRGFPLHEACHQDHIVAFLDNLMNRSKRLLWLEEVFLHAVFKRLTQLVALQQIQQHAFNTNVFESVD